MTSKKKISDSKIAAILAESDNDLSDESGKEFTDEEDSEVEDNVSYDEDSSSSSSSESGSESEEDVHEYITSRDGTKWTKKSPNNRGRRLQRNTLRVAPGLTNYSKNIITPLNAFQLLFDDEILDIIIKYSEQKAEQLNHPEWKLSKELLKAFIGMLISFGATRGRKESIACVWSQDAAFSRPIFKATMSRDVFKNIMRFIRTDDLDTRIHRRSTDKLAAIRDVWEIFTENSQKCLVPESEMCVDEQLVGFRGRCPFRVYMKSKPDRYGIKIWAICENPSGYIWKSQVYTGKKGSTAEKNQGKRVVLDMVQGLGQGYGITCDNFFTSLELAKELAKEQKTLLGTLRKNRKEVPKEMLAVKSRQVCSSMFLSTDDSTMVSYVPAKNRIVLLLSSQHHERSISTLEHAKPTMILDYNKTKGAVDSADKMLKEFSCNRISKRWPFVLLTHIINACSLNAFILYKKKYPNIPMTRLTFLKKLGTDLVTPAIRTRAIPPRTGINMSVQNAMGIVIGSLPINPSAQILGAKRNRCGFCLRTKDNKYNVKCITCSMFICPEHTGSKVTHCVKCLA